MFTVGCTIFSDKPIWAKRVYYAGASADRQKSCVTLYFYTPGGRIVYSSLPRLAYDFVHQPLDPQRQEGHWNKSIDVTPSPQPHVA